jgi:hypothetical protein
MATADDVVSGADVSRREITFDGAVFKLFADGGVWRTIDPATGAELWFRPVRRPHRADFWFVGEPLKARFLCALWCGACERAGVDPRPPERSVPVSGTFRRLDRQRPGSSRGTPGRGKAS